METRPIKPQFGVEVLDVDLAAAADGEIDTLMDLLVEHQVLLLRRQSLNDAEQARLATAFGPVNVASKKTDLAPGHEEVMYISNLHDPDMRLIGGLKKGDDSESTWHSDQSFRDRPATISTLFCVNSPATDGGTSVASTVLGYEALPDSLKIRLEGMNALYKPRPGHQIEIVEVTHPAVLANPKTGKKAVYVSELCHGFDGLGEDEGLSLRDEVMGYVLQPEHIYTHHWRMGDILIYDNAQTLHRREAYAGLRWLKGTRSYAPTNRFAQP
ncbi:MAG: TauD/TfdA family dioxygenase [Pseudomonadota bacterium]